jgi:hypothetical protein
MSHEAAAMTDGTLQPERWICPPPISAATESMSCVRDPVRWARPVHRHAAARSPDQTNRKRTLFAAAAAARGGEYAN